MAIPLFSPVIVPMAQNFGPFLSQIASSSTFRLGVRFFTSKIVPKYFFGGNAALFFLLLIACLMLYKRAELPEHDHKPLSFWSDISLY